MASSDRKSKSSASVATFPMDQTQREFDVQFFGLILQRNGDNPDVMRRQAELLAEAGDHRGALQLDQQLALRFPEDAVVHYNLACSYALMRRRDQALQALQRSLELGYSDFARLEADSDLDVLRSMPAYRQLMRRYGLED